MTALRLLAACTAFSLAVARSAEAGQAPAGETLYKARCAACHDTAADARTPSRQALQNMTPSRILRALDFGAMMTIAYTLNRDEREAVARFLGKPGPEPAPREGAYCRDRSVRLGDLSKEAWHGWSPSRNNARFVPASLANLTARQVPSLKLKWAFGFDGDIAAMAQPAVIGNQIFVGSAAGVVHALRADTGCLQWTFQANGAVRASIVAEPIDGGHLLLFGDLTGWFYALDAATGKPVWRVRPDEHEAVRITAPPVVHNGLVLVPVASWEESRALNLEYPCCTFRGSLTALRLRDGTIAWKRFMIPAAAQRTGKSASGAETFGPSGAGIWGSPALDLKRNRVYVATGNNYSRPGTPLSDAVVAIDLDTGAIAWSQQALPEDVYNSGCSLAPKLASCPEGSGPDYDFGSPPIVVTTGGRDLVLAGQKAGIVWAFDPDANGTVVWQTRVGKGGINGGVQWGMASDGERVYAASSDVVVRRTATTRELDPTAGGGLTALRLSDGAVMWHAAPPPCPSTALGARGRPNCSPAQSAALTAIPGVVFSGSVDGHLRAYSAADGRVIWSYDTVREYEAVNGILARGGAIDGPGAVVVNGMVLVNSGYMRFGGAPGNVLLAFAP